MCCESTVSYLTTPCKCRINQTECPIKHHAGLRQPYEGWRYSEQPEASPRGGQPLGVLRCISVQLSTACSGPHAVHQQMRKTGRRAKESRGEQFNRGCWPGQAEGGDVLAGIRMGKRYDMWTGWVYGGQVSAWAQLRVHQKHLQRWDRIVSSARHVVKQGWAASQTGAGGVGFVGCKRVGRRSGPFVLGVCSK